ncbi:high mobility group B protein 14-like protein [Carex littledalei]|uniref:High mobility group B protein 14-like protein n=1 Tax=Carex littledalei TaxID=544730 RepID=A0A833QUP6_9POAL|nr:high mobility group B protein 14-like protein [Carex littledalei]
MKTRSRSSPEQERDKKKPTATATAPKSLKAKKSSLKDDPRKPKKPPTAFFFYLEDFRKTFQQENPNVKSMRQIGKACGDKWRTLSFEEKVAYYDIATEKRAEFEKTMAEYIKRTENGELSDESEDEL